MITEGHAHFQRKKNVDLHDVRIYYIFCQDLNNDHGKAVNGYSSLIVSR